jgi:beta-phosphoglucomutase-like phosphatase (HAD superfamily)
MGDDRSRLRAMTVSGREPRLASVLANTSAVLLDFDGPVTQLMPNGVNRAIATEMRKVLDRHGADVPERVLAAEDPLTVLRFAAETQTGAILSEVEDMCRRGEIAAAQLSVPTPGGHEAIEACHEAGRPLVIMSNNGPDAIGAYLDRHGLHHLVLGVVARPDGRPELMKPHPALIKAAVGVLETAFDRCAFIGDSLTDIEVSIRTGVHPIGYGKTLTRGAQLDRAGAEATIYDMNEIAVGVRRVAPSR